MHTQHWRVVRYLPLGVPRADWVERLIQGACTVPDCGAWVEITGEMQQRYPLETPEFWEPYRRTEQRLRTPEARAAQQAMQGGRRR